MSRPRTRLAPSPTGALHLGNARTFLVNWALARQNGWEVVMRIEDLDGPRIQTGAAQQALDILGWLGLNYDEGPHTQLDDLAPYHEALARLADRGLIYPCSCTRSQIASAQSAPHRDKHELRYPGTCAPDPSVDPPGYEAISLDSSDQAPAWRLVTEDAHVDFHDHFAGPQSHNPQRTVGDFVVATRANLPAYQLAVVIDDVRQDITHVVRGDDLITSTPRQLLIYRALGLGPEPAYYHLPLVLGPDGRRLAKRHGDTRLTTYRERGVTAERIIGLLAEWSGLGPRHPMSATGFADAFDIERLPREAVTLTDEDHRWLLDSSEPTSS
ncbi:MAG: tRNA glutamyl-Q(34) synthetase GluQRS [Planctomycetota bacterium]|jgi:glutamyl-tRNA synthetase